MAEIVNYVVHNKIDNDKFSSVHVGANLYAFSAVTLAYTAAIQQANLEFRGHNLTPEEAAICDFVVVKSGPEQGLFYSLEEQNKLVSLLKAKVNFIELPEKFLMPDDSYVTIYKKVNYPTLK